MEDLYIYIALSLGAVLVIYLLNEPGVMKWKGKGDKHTWTSLGPRELNESSIGFPYNRAVISETELKRLTRKVGNYGTLTPPSKDLRRFGLVEETENLKVMDNFNREAYFNILRTEERHREQVKQSRAIRRPGEKTVLRRKFYILARIY